MRILLPDALVRTDFVEKLLRRDARTVHGIDRGVVDGQRGRQARVDFRVDAVRAFRSAQPGDGNYLNRIALFYSAHFVSSLLALAALFALWRTNEANPA